MAKKIKVPSFLERVKQVAQEEGLTDQNLTMHAAWSAAFDRANEDERHALTREWLTHFTKMELPVRGERTRSFIIGMAKHRKWLERIAPYIKPATLKELLLEDPRSNLDLTHILTGSPTTVPASAHFRLMWLGTDQEKLDQLEQTLAYKDLGDYALFNGPLVPALFWDAAQLPGAKKEHHIAACIGAYWSGYMGNHPNPEAPLELQAWQLVGSYTKGANQFKLKKNAEDSTVKYYEKIKHYPAFCREMIQHSPVEVVCRLFMRTMSYIRVTAEGSRTTGALFTNECQGMDIYGILAHWAPAYKKQIEVAQLSGMTIEEVVAYLPQLHTPTANPGGVLPQDMQP